MVSTTEPVSGQSLSKLIELADDPPLHLDGRLRREQRSSLVMYIARVPGSRDVFLTTMKPRDKVVSAQDVESSLYYCHLETAADDAMRASLEDDLVDSTSTGQADAEDLNQAQQPPHPVLPLRPGSESAPPSHSPLTPRTVPSVPPVPSPLLPPREGHAKIARKPVGGDVATPPAPSPSLPARPLGPRPMGSPALGSAMPAGKENIQLTATSHKPPLPPRQGSIDTVSPQPARPPLPIRKSTNNTTSLPSPALPPRRDSMDAIASAATKRDFAVTLIRRDPGSGQQWNVGRMARSSRSEASGDVVLTLPTAGYAKFDARSLTQPSASAPPPFERTLSLRRRPDAGTQVPFSFASPWDGPCAFATGVAGRSLRCRHVFPPPTGASFNPKLALLDSAPVSELRLNLPVFARNKHGRANKATRDRRPSLGAAASASSLSVDSRLRGHAPGHRPAKSVDASVYGDGQEWDDEWDDARESANPLRRMDLSLGRERAGGGFGGKKAKLGKIIVEGEGLLMLDLVILANMAIWWAVAEEGDG